MNGFHPKFLSKISQTPKDLIVILIISILVLFLSIALNLPLSIAEFIETNNAGVLDDLVPVSIVLIILLAVFSYRRWAELAAEIQERKGVEHALLTANKRLQILNDITRHDIINSLTGLFLLLKRSETKEKDPEIAKNIQKEREIAQLIQRQIAFTKDYQDIGVRKPEWQSVEDVITKAWIGHKIDRANIDIDIHGLEIFADLLLEKVFYNLIDNSLKYGGPTLTTIRFTAHAEGEFMVITCEDDGLGVSEEMKKNLFKTGFGTDTGYGLFPTTGYGLFLIRDILSITGLSIAEAGRPGSGARFDILVPRGLFRMTGAGIK